MKVGELLYFQFTIFQADGLTPWTGQAGSSTSVLRYNNTISGVSVNIAEIGSSGSYTASFTPNAVGEWDLEVTNSDDRVVGEQYIVENVDKDDLKTEIDANETKIDALQVDVTAILGDTNEMQGKLPTNNMMGSSTKTDKDDEIDAIKAQTDNLPASPADEATINEVLDLLENKLRINTTTSTLNLYNDAGDTIIKTWPLTDFEDKAIVLSGGGPANRGTRTL